MTSVDSGVETGNDSNDSGQADTQLLFVPPSSSAVIRGRVHEMKVKNHDDSLKQLVPVERSDDGTSRTMVCLAPNQSSLSVHFTHDGLKLSLDRSPDKISYKVINSTFL